MSIIEYIIGGVLLAIALVLITFIMLQESKRRGLSGVLTGSTSDSYFGKNRAKTKERFYSRLTTVLSVIFAVLVLTLYIVHAKSEKADNASSAADTASVVSTETASSAAGTASATDTTSAVSSAADTSSAA